MEQNEKQRTTKGTEIRIKCIFHLVLGCIIGMTGMAILMERPKETLLKLQRMSTHDSILFDLDHDQAFHTRFFYVLGAMKDSTMIVTVSRKR